jgi:hypothetical protein
MVHIWFRELWTLFRSDVEEVFEELWGQCHAALRLFMKAAKNTCYSMDALVTLFEDGVLVFPPEIYLHFQR